MTPVDWSDSRSTPGDFQSERICRGRGCVIILNLVPGILGRDSVPGSISFRHPDYTDRWWWREFYRICYLGGREYLRPVRLSIEFQEPVPVTLTADGQLPGGTSGTGQLQYEPLSQQIKSVLFRHNREKSWEYENRRKRAHYINFIQPITKSLVSHATKKAATREGSDALMEFWEGVDCDRDESIGNFMRDGLRWAQVLGIVWACVDKKAADSADPDADGKPYAYWVSPLDIFDWGIDDQGRIEWLKQFVYTEQKRTWSDPIIPVYRFRVWTATDVTTYEVDKSGKAMVEKRRSHDAGRVPFEPLFSQRDRESVFPDGTPIMGDACKVANSIFNYSSLKDEIGYKQTFSWLAIPDKKVDTIAIGMNTAFGYDPSQTSAVPTYVSPDAEQARVLMEFIQSGLEQLRQMLGVGRGRQEGSMQKSSEGALELENEDKRSILGDIAAEAQDFERRLADLVSAYNGEENAKTETVIKYATDYDLRSFGDEIDEYLKFAQVGLSPEVELLAKQDLVQKKFAELPPEEIDRLAKSMEDKQKADAEAAKKMVDTANGQGQSVDAMGTTHANQPPHAGSRQPLPPNKAGAATGAVEPGKRY